MKITSFFRYVVTSLPPKIAVVWFWGMILITFYYGTKHILPFLYQSSFMLQLQNCTSYFLIAQMIINWLCVRFVSSKYDPFASRHNFGNKSSKEKTSESTIKKNNCFTIIFEVLRIKLKSIFDFNKNKTKPLNIENNMVFSQINLVDKSHNIRDERNGRNRECMCRLEEENEHENDQNYFKDYHQIINNDTKDKKSFFSNKCLHHSDYSKAPHNRSIEKKDCKKFNYSNKIKNYEKEILESNKTEEKRGLFPILENESASEMLRKDANNLKASHFMNIDKHPLRYQKKEAFEIDLEQLKVKKGKCEIIKETYVLPLSAIRAVGENPAHVWKHDTMYLVALHAGEACYVTSTYPQYNYGYDYHLPHSNKDENISIIKEKNYLDKECDKKGNIAKKRLYRNQKNEERIIKKNTIEKNLISKHSGLQGKKSKVVVYPYWSWKPCNVCGIDRPPRTHHCMQCRCCVLKRDHHCFFAANCIGLNNQRHFIVLLLWSCIGVFFSLFHACWYIIHRCHLYTLNSKSFHCLSNIFLPITIYRTFITDGACLNDCVLVGVLYSLVWFFFNCVGLLVEQAILLFSGKTSFEEDNNIHVIMDDCPIDKCVRESNQNTHGNRSSPLKTDEENLIALNQHKKNVIPCRKSKLSHDNILNKQEIVSYSIFSVNKDNCPMKGYLQNTGSKNPINFKINNNNTFDINGHNLYNNYEPKKRQMYSKIPNTMETCDINTRNSRDMNKKSLSINHKIFNNARQENVNKFNCENNFLKKNNHENGCEGCYDGWRPSDKKNDVFNKGEKNIRQFNLLNNEKIYCKNQKNSLMNSFEKTELEENIKTNIHEENHKKTQHKKELIRCNKSNETCNGQCKIAFNKYTHWKCNVHAVFGNYWYLNFLFPLHFIYPTIDNGIDWNRINGCVKHIEK